MPQYQRLSVRRAFTLIELLVVIAIIAILAAILFPVFAQAKAAAKQAGTISNVKQNALAVVMYANDADDTCFMPWQDGAWVYGDGIHGAYAVQKLYPYTKNIDICWDLASGIPNFAGGRPTPADRYWGDWTSTGTLGWSNAGLMRGDGNPPRVLSAQEHPAELMIMASCSQPSGGVDQGCFAFPATQPSCYNANGVRGRADANSVGRAAAKWHNGGIVSGFADGHAALAKGMIYTAPNNDCDTQTYDWWAGKSSKGDYTPNNAWSTHYLTPRVLNYWGTWWDATK